MIETKWLLKMLPMWRLWPLSVSSIPLRGAEVDREPDIYINIYIYIYIFVSIWYKSLYHDEHEIYMYVTGLLFDGH